MCANYKTVTIDDLPAELFHAILDHLDCRDCSTRASCTLVCRGWLDISRQHLFGELDLLRGSDETFEGFVDWIEQHETHAGYIRTLTLEARLVSVPPQASFMPSLPISLLSRLLRVLPNLQELRMHHVNVIASTASPSLPSTYPKRYSLEHMEFENCICELRLAYEFLSWFHIDHFDFDPIFPDAQDTTIEQGDYALDVRSLCVIPFTSDPFVVFQTLQQVVRPNMLRSFRYASPHVYPAPIPVVDFLRNVGQDIVDLNLCSSARDDYLVLPQLPSLQVFRYHPFVPFFCDPASLCDQQLKFAPFKDTWIPHLPADLERLVFYISYGDVVARPGPTSTALWGLETVLAARLRRLKKFTIVFPDLPSSLAAAAAAVAVCFPTFHERGVLDVDVRTWASECRDWDIYGYLRDC